MFLWRHSMGLAIAIGLCILTQAQTPPIPVQDFPPPQMVSQCPLTSKQLQFLAPKLPNALNGHCTTDRTDHFCTPPPCGGGCKDPQLPFCNLDTQTCDKCEPGHCCVTIPASMITDKIIAAMPVFGMGMAGSHAASSRLSGPVVLYKRACPRNYHCEVPPPPNEPQTTKQTTNPDTCFERL
eukprot:SAG11_NODE_8307_length_1031_cov_1.752146_1_plen_181_part_00